jgi:hypothetical protein
VITSRTGSNITIEVEGASSDWSEERKAFHRIEKLLEKILSVLEHPPQSSTFAAPGKTATMARVG